MKLIDKDISSESEHLKLNKCPEYCVMSNCSNCPNFKEPLVDIEIPFGAKDSELLEESIYIPDGCYAVIEGNKVIIRKKL